ncbi:MAG: glycosyltransferase, partial [Methanomassiliicoccales archaeon]|nr:glycosyltransferase [Methanomassiliicoccales archaeon]
MPFDRQGTWTVPVEADHSNFHNSLMSKRQEIAPTQEMIQAIAANLPNGSTTVRTDVFGTIGKLQGPVDIVIPVYGGLHVLRPCIESIIKHTEWDYRLIIVDDCSPDPAVGEYLRSLEELHPGIRVELLFNRKNRGFAPTVNRGAAAGDNPYLCILNSDTLVTEGWLTRQLMALEADEKNVIVNPVTNNTALVNVAMYSGCSYKDMANAVAVAPNTLTYNEIMPTGFCFTMRRKLWEEVGPFDEAYISYGEETDFWFKAIKQTDKNGVILRNRGVIADNAYVFHERGTSFSQLGAEEHMGLRRSGSSRFNEIHPDFASWQNGFSADGSVNHLRNELDRDNFKTEYKGNVAWVVKSAGMCGGMGFITDIVNQMIEEGYNAKVCVVPDNYDEANPPILQVIGSLRTAPILFKSHAEFTSTFKQRVFSGAGKVFAAVTELSPIVWDLEKTYRDIEGYNHVQSYDPDLAVSLGMPELVEAFEESYRRLPNVVSSKWVADKIKALGGEVCTNVLPGINQDLFHPRDRSLGDERFTVAILINRMYGFKGADWAEEFLKELNPSGSPELRVLAIGPKHMDIRGVTCLGDLSPAKMADLLGSEIDVLVDPAQIHSYGLPSLEALASGCRVLCRENGGINEIMDNWKGKVFVTEDVKRAVEQIERWGREGEYDRLTGTAIHGVEDRALNVQRFIHWAFPVVCEKNHRIEVITPH